MRSGGPSFNLCLKQVLRPLLIHQWSIRCLDVNVELQKERVSESDTLDMMYCLHFDILSHYKSTSAITVEALLSPTSFNGTVLYRSGKHLLCLGNGSPKIVHSVTHLNIVSNHFLTLNTCECFFFSFDVLARYLYII